MARSNAAEQRKAPSAGISRKTRETPLEPANKVIHERKRLAIISALAVNPSLTFTELKQLLDMTDGNLSVHAQKLEAAGYIACKKGFEGRIPKTEYRITVLGRKALEAYLAHMEALIQAVRKK